MSRNNSFTPGAVNSTFACTTTSGTTPIALQGTGSTVLVQNVTSVEGDVYWICPDSTGQDVKVYPATGGTINQGVANAAVIVDSVRGGVSFVCYAANAWASGVLV